MGIFASFDRAIQAAANPGPLNDFWYRDLEYPVISDAGIPITPQGAMRISTFWKCVRWRSQQFGMLPKKLLERVTILDRPAQQEAREHPLYRLVHSAPNPATTSMAFFEHLSHDLDTEGNFYAFVDRNERTGRIRALWRLRPDRARIETERIENTEAPGGKGWRLWYYFRDETGVEFKFWPDEILHIRGMGFDGIKGYSPVRMQMNALGWNYATMRYGSQFFKNASRPSGLVIADQPIKDPKVKQELIEALTRSGRNAGSLALVEGGLKFQKITMDQDEAQFVDTVQWQEEDIAGIMNVKPHKIGIMRHMTNNNVEQQNIEAVTDCLQPLCVRVEQWMDLQLLSGVPSTGIGGATEQDRYFFQCELKGLLRGDTKAQTEHIEAMIDRGVYSQNDALGYLGLSPVEGGDRRWINSTYVPIDRADDMVESRMASPANDVQSQDLRGAYAEVFRDAVGRVIARKKADRERATPAIFGRVISGLRRGLRSLRSDDFATEYIGSMAQRAPEWSDAEAVTVAEMERAFAAFGDDHA